MTEILIPVSPGELLDKLIILRIKARRMTDPAQLAHVRLELGLLERTWAATPYAGEVLPAEIGELESVNERLWDIEDDIRALERDQDFGAAFVALARGIYRHNDERAAIKKRINTRLGSRLVEEKFHASCSIHPAGDGPAAAAAPLGAAVR